MKLDSFWRSPAQQVDKSNIIFITKWIISTAINGWGPFLSAENLAQDYLSRHNNPEKAINALIRKEVVKAVSSGFFMGLPGVFALPLTLPANVGTDYLFSARLVAAIAHLRGWDIHSKRVHALIGICLLGTRGAKYIKNISAIIGAKTAQNIVNTISVQMLNKINKRVGVKIFSQIFRKGALPLAKGIPFVGGLVSASIDSCFLLICAKTAKYIFHCKTTKF